MVHYGDIKQSVLDRGVGGDVCVVTVLRCVAYGYYQRRLNFSVTSASNPTPKVQKKGRSLTVA